MTTPATRRDFIAASAVSLVTFPTVHATGSETLRVGLVGCGGRGTGAAGQALKADKNVKLVALADAFIDRLQTCLDNLKKRPEIADKVDVTPDRCFVGFDGYKEVIANSDVVLLCTPPHFRPQHLKACVEAGKHVFAEKPVAVDAPGVRAVLEACELAKKKSLSIVSGLCMRYSNGMKEAIRRIHDGAIGEPTALFANDYRGTLWVKPRQPGWTDMEYQMRNWYYYTWLSGDFNVEQHIHMLDVAAWVMKSEYPMRAIGMGGRAARTGPEYGHIYDHFSVIYEYPNGARLVGSCRQQAGTKNEISCHVLGGKGRAVLSSRDGGLFIRGENGEWVFPGPANDMFQTEHDELFASIRNGQPINNGDYMAKSTLLAIMGRMAAYTGQQITWEMALNSREDLSPPSYDWSVQLPEPAVAVPGKTKFV